MSWRSVQIRSAEAGDQTLIAFVHEAGGRFEWQLVRYGPSRHLVFLESGHMSTSDGAHEVANGQFEAWEKMFREGKLYEPHLSRP